MSQQYRGSVNDLQTSEENVVSLLRDVPVHGQN